MVRTQVQLPEESMRAVRRLAAERGVSIAAIFREAIDTLVASRRVASAESKKARAAAAVGRFRSGRGDLSERHDDHFAEAAGR
jgi:predicted transcriptional regulator